MATRAWSLLLLAAWVGVGLTHAHIIRLDAGESECLYEEFGAEHLLEGEDQQTVPTEVALAFIVRAHKLGRNTISNPVSVNASDPYGNVLVQKDNVHEEVRTSLSRGWVCVCVRRGLSRHECSMWATVMQRWRVLALSSTLRSRKGFWFLMREPWPPRCALLAGRSVRRAWHGPLPGLLCQQLQG